LKPGLKLAVIGPLADATRVLRGNYSSTQSAPPISVLAGLRQVLPQASITHIPAPPSMTDGDPVPPTAYLTPDGQPGLLAEYFNASGDSNSYASTPAASRVERELVSGASSIPQVSERNKVVWSGFLVAPEGGMYRIGVTGVRGAIEVDGRPAIAASVPSKWAEALKLTDVRLEKGQRYRLRLETEAGVTGVPGVFWKRVADQPDALRAAADADVLVAVVGLTADLEGEELALNVEGFSGGDRTSLDLPADQRRLLEQAQATGKPLVIVVMSGSALDLSWAKQHAAAIVQAWYPGQAGGQAVAQVVTGQANPGGRLPLTFYASVKDLPPFDDYSMKGRTYRYFEGTPVYPFGFGLTYTSFAYAPLKIAVAKNGAEHGATVTAQVTNTGQREGDEVVQLYLKPPAFEGAPRHALRSFQRVSLKAGETRRVVFRLSPRDLSFVTRDGRRQLMAGQYGVVVGSGQPDSGVPGQRGALTMRRAVALSR